MYGWTPQSWTRLFPAFYGTHEKIFSIYKVNLLTGSRVEIFSRCLQYFSGLKFTTEGRNPVSKLKETRLEQPYISRQALWYNRHAIASLTEQNNRIAHSQNCCCGRILLAYLATSSAKSDITFLLGDPDFLYRWQNFTPILLSFWDVTWDRQRQTTDATTVSWDSYTYSVRA